MRRARHDDARAVEPREGCHMASGPVGLSKNRSMLLHGSSAWTRTKPRGVRARDVRLNTLEYSGRHGNRTRLVRLKRALRHLDANLPHRGTPEARTRPCQGKSLLHPWVLTSHLLSLWTLFHRVLLVPHGRVERLRATRNGVTTRRTCPGADRTGYKTERGRLGFPGRPRRASVATILAASATHLRIARHDEGGIPLRMDIFGDREGARPRGC